MQKLTAETPKTAAVAAASFPIVLALSFTHFLNDLVQALLPAIYPIIKESYNLDFGQIGLLTLAFQLTASMFQPLVGIMTDRKPQPFSLSAGMGATLVVTSTVVDQAPGPVRAALNVVGLLRWDELPPGG